jgi:hypothetical protein
MTRLLRRAPFVLGLLPLAIACGEGSTGTGDPAVGGTGGTQSSAAGTMSGGSPGTSGSTGNAGSPGAGTGGTTAGSSSGGQAGQSTGGAAAGTGAGSGGSAGAGTPSTEKFSFFVTSLKAMVELSKNEDGFGGDLRFGETGDGAGLRGADKICTTIAEKSMPRNNKTWRAFLSATKGADGNPVNAIDRVGEGPWYDRAGRLVAMNATDLVNVRPQGADEAIINDLPNEDGVPNHEPDPGAGEVDNHDVLTGTNEQGKLFSTDAGATCDDWTSSAESGKPHCGHSWPRMGGPGGGFPGGGGLDNWMSALNEAGCAPGAWIIEAGPPGANGTKSVGDGGGYGGIYCFALTP